ncbi:MAG: S53 family peptidase [Terriglobales bacterium]|jgi:subtilase family serine protease
MTLQRLLRGLAVTAVISLLAVGGSSAYAQAAATNVPASIQFSQDLGLADPSMEINITVHFKLNDKAAFDKAVDALQDPASPTFHKWMTKADLRKYAPAESQRQAVRRELESHGLTILSTDPIGFTIRAHGTIANVESAFNTEIHQFQHNGKVFRANVRNAGLNGEAGDYVSTVAGLESHQVRPLYARALNPRTQKPYPPVQISKLAGSSFPVPTTTDCLTSPATYTLEYGGVLPEGVYTGTVYIESGVPCAYLPQQLQTAYGLNAVYEAGLNGAGQTIVLMEGYGYPTIEKDANEYFKLTGVPLLNKSNFSIIYPEGKPNPKLGAETGWDVEIALDVQSSHSIAPGANILVVATNGQDSEDFQNSIAYVAQNGLGNQISNSYGEDLDLESGTLEQTSWDEAIEVATAQGISVNFSSGDGGDEGLGTPIGAPLVPSVAPHATAVGGTSILNDVSHPGSTITTSWGDTLTFLSGGYEVFDPPLPLGLIGGGGGGESVFWPKPSWESSIPGKNRQVPDVSALADPYTGIPIVITSDGEQFVSCCWGGTSLASPIFTAFWALANEKAGSPLGQAAPLIAALPYGGVQDVLPTTDSTSNNVSGSITDASGTTTYSAADLFSGSLYGNKGFTSAIWAEDAGDVLDFGFGIDSSLTVKHGWDNATGWGTPNGLTFIDAVTATE